MKLFMAVSAMRRCEYVSWTLQGSRRSCHRYYRLSAFSHCFLPFSLPLGWRCAAAVLARRVNRRIDHDGISAAVGALVCLRQLFGGSFLHVTRDGPRGSFNTFLPSEHG